MVRGEEDNAAGIVEEKIQDGCIDITFPQVTGLRDESVEDKINLLIRQQVESLIPAEGCAVFAEIFGTYRIHLNTKGILSLSIEFYTIRHRAANGLNVRKSITVDLETGQVCRLYQLFKRNSGYRILINRIIREQIKQQDLHLIREFKGIDDYRDYYLTEDALVIYLQELEYTIHAEGIPEFVIPFVQLKNLIKDEGPIAKLTTG